MIAWERSSIWPLCTLSAAGPICMCLRLCPAGLVLLAVVHHAPVVAQLPLSVERGSHPYRIENVLIGARDGVWLHARVWMPLDLEAPAPTLLTLTPYTSDTTQRYGRFYASHGFVYVAADVRGRGESEGEWWPLERDGPDGADVIQWITAQPWSDGQVGMLGGSYTGMTQWQTLKEFPEGLITIVPTASVHPGWDFPNPSGIFLSYAARWLAYVEGRALQSNLFGENPYFDEKFVELYESHRPFADLDDLTGLPARVFERWIAHPWYDEHWQRMNPAPEDYARIAVPILTITGHFDGDQPGAMKYYADHMNYGSDTGKAEHYLIIGPWSHAGTRTPQRELGGLTFGENSVVDMEAVHLAWFDWILRGGPKPEFLRDRVAYYVVEANEWKFAPSLEAVAQERRDWYLASDGVASDVFHSGMLADVPPDEPRFDELIYDPLVVLDTASYPAESMVGGGLAFVPGPKVVYHSAPLGEALEVSGYASLELFLELDVPDTDLFAALYEVKADGTTIDLGGSALRVRHRNGVDRSELFPVGSTERVRFEAFMWFSRLVAKGSRLRLVVAPLNGPYRDKNYNSGGNTIEETGAVARTATIRIHHGPDRTSQLSLPVARR